MRPGPGPGERRRRGALALVLVTALGVATLPGAGCGDRDSDRPFSRRSRSEQLEVPWLQPGLAAVRASVDSLPPELARALAPWTGDLPGIAERRVLRLLTVFNPMLYFLEGPRPRGIVQEAALALEQELDRAFAPQQLHFQVIVVPTTRDRLLDDLVSGRGDVVAANLTVTPERLERIDFTVPMFVGVDEVVVTGPRSPRLDALDDLAGQEVMVRPSSSYHTSLLALDSELRGKGLDGILLTPAPEVLEDGDLLEMVNAGMLGITVVDSHKAGFWEGFLERIEVHRDLRLRTGGTIAWALRKDSPELRAFLDEFVRRHRQGTLFGNVVYRRYLEEAPHVRNSLDRADRERFLQTARLFREYAGRYGLDWLLVAAQAYQESQLDQSRRSAAGAVGVMQIRPATARAVGIESIDELEPNIHAGVRYMRTLIDRYFDDPHLPEGERRLFALAAYNAGPTRVRALRRAAPAAGLDPDRWFDNVEVLAARRIGAEPVRYVGNVMKYYTAYRLVADQMRLRGELD